MATRWYWAGDGDEFIGGVPQTNLSDEQFESYPEHVQNDIRASPLYASRNPSPATRSRSTETEAPAQPDETPDTPAEGGE